MEPLNPAESFGRRVRVHAVSWLVAANVLGVVCALLLVYPLEPDLARVLNYGRLVTVHMNVQLYGWCALPLAGLLLVWYGRAPGEGPAEARAVLWSWSAALTAGVVAWLGGAMQSKPFMEWVPVSAALMGGAMVVFWVVLAHEMTKGGWSGSERAARWGLLVLLAVVPIGFYLASDGKIYPSVNPHSGGATGTSLLRSTLGIVAIYGVAPALLRLPKRLGESAWQARFFWAYFALCVLASFLTPGGHETNRSFAAVFGLALLLGWIPLLGWRLKAFVWNASAQAWLRAGLVWWALLVVSGFLTYLPDLLDRYKFTHLLVAHAHLAMAGVVSCVGWAFLHSLDGASPDRRWVRRCWNGALAVHLAALVALAWLETEHAGALYSNNGYVRCWLGLRLGAGIVMTGASLVWLADLFRPASASAQGPQAGAVARERRTSLPAVSPARVRFVAQAAGLMDLSTGLGLVFAPQFTLRLMQASVATPEGLHLMRFVGCFVGAVGASYLVGVAAGPAALRTVLSVTRLFRGAAGLFTLYSVAAGLMPVAWLSVSLTDLGLVALQTWLLRKEGLWS